MNNTTILCLDKMTGKITYLNSDQIQNKHSFGFIVREYDDNLHIPPILSNLDENFLYLLGIMLLYGIPGNTLLIRLKSNERLYSIIQQLNQFGYGLSEVNHELDYRTFEIHDDDEITMFRMYKFLNTLDSKGTIYWMTLINYYATYLIVLTLPDKITLTFPEHYRQYCYVIQQLLAKNHIVFKAEYDDVNCTIKIRKVRDNGDLMYRSGYAWFVNSSLPNDQEQIKTSGTSVNNIEVSTS